MTRWEPRDAGAGDGASAPPGSTDPTPPPPEEGTRLVPPSFPPGYGPVGPSGPHWPPPPGPPPAGGGSGGSGPNTTLIVAIVLAVLLVVVSGVVIALVLRDDGTRDDPVAPATTPASEDPTTTSESSSTVVPAPPSSMDRTPASSITRPTEPPTTPPPTAPPTTAPVITAPGREAEVLAEPAGLFCRDLYADGYDFNEAMIYWQSHGFPEQMDADSNGVPCETVYPSSEIDEWYLQYGG